MGASELADSSSVAVMNVATDREAEARAARLV